MIFDITKIVTPVWPTPRAREWAKQIVSRFLRVTPSPAYAPAEKKPSKLDRHRAEVKERLESCRTRTNDGTKAKRLVTERNNALWSEGADPLTEIL